jgi:hypothetical protein
MQAIPIALLAAGALVKGVAGYQAGQANKKIAGMNARTSLEEGNAQAIRIRDLARVQLGGRSAPRPRAVSRLAPARRSTAWSKARPIPNWMQWTRCARRKSRANAYQFQGAQAAQEGKFALISGFVGAASSVASVGCRTTPPRRTGARAMAGVQERIYEPAQGVSSATPVPGVSPDAYGAGLGGAIEQAGGQLEASQLRAMRAENSASRKAPMRRPASAAADLSLSLRPWPQARATTRRSTAPATCRRFPPRPTLVGKFLDARSGIRLSAIAGKRALRKCARTRSATRTPGREASGSLDRHQCVEAPSGCAATCCRAIRIRKALDQSLKDIDTFWGGISTRRRRSRPRARSRTRKAPPTITRTVSTKRIRTAASRWSRAARSIPWLKPEHKKELINEAQTNIRIADGRRQRRQVRSRRRRSASTRKRPTTDQPRRAGPSDDQVKGIITGRRRWSATDPSLKNVADTLTYNLGVLKMSRITDKWTRRTGRSAHQRALAAKVAQGKASGDEQRQLKILQQLRPARKRASNRIPTAAAASGISPPQFDLDHPGNCRRRAQVWAAPLPGPAGLIEPPYLSKDQLAPIASALPRAPVAQLEVADELRQTWGACAPSIVRQIGGAPAAEMLSCSASMGDRAGLPARPRSARQESGRARRQDAAPGVGRSIRAAPPDDLQPALFDAARKIAGG